MVFYNVTKILQLLRQIEFEGDRRHILNVGVNRRIVTPKNNNLIPQAGYLNFFEVQNSKKSNGSGNHRLNHIEL